MGQFGCHRRYLVGTETFLSDKDSNLVTHVYGIASLVPGVISLVASYQKGATWSELLLLGAGWITAAILALMVFRCFGLLAKAYKENGRLEELTHSLRRELDSRNGTLDYVVAAQLGKTATPRATPGGTQQVQE